MTVYLDPDERLRHRLLPTVVVVAAVLLLGCAAVLVLAFA